LKRIIANPFRLLPSELSEEQHIRQQEATIPTN